MSANVIILSGLGLNCEDETLFAFNKAGAKGKIIHVNDLIKNPSILNDFQILAVPGGFSYGDDTGSGNALANRLRLRVWENINEFITKDKLVIGICNGCQVLVNLGLAPALEKKYGERQAALMHNESGIYQCRWVYLKAEKTNCVWTKNLDKIYVPVAHGEGNFAFSDGILNKAESQNIIALRYIKPDGSLANKQFPYNPNGSINDIAGITDPTGKILALMPHPERAIEADGLGIFKNGVEYFN